MFSANWLRGHRIAPRAPRRQLSLECLESRLLLTFTPIAQPNATYLSGTYVSETTKIQIPSSISDGTTVTSLADSKLKVSFSPGLLAETAGSSIWPNWAGPPQTENASPRVLEDLEAANTVGTSFLTLPSASPSAHSVWRWIPPTGALKT
jgi:hypothetical protein